MISVIIPTYNPSFERLNQTLEGLKQQSLSPAYWELIIIDNNSNNQFHKSLDLIWYLKYNKSYKRSYNFYYICHIL